MCYLKYIMGPPSDKTLGGGLGKRFLSEIIIYGILRKLLNNIDLRWVALIENLTCGWLKLEKINNSMQIIGDKNKEKYYGRDLLRLGIFRSEGIKSAVLFAGDQPLDIGPMAENDKKAQDDA